MASAYNDFIEELLVVGYNLSSGLLLLELQEDFEVPSELLLPTILLGTDLQLVLSPVIEWISAHLGFKTTLLVAAVSVPSSFFTFFWLPVSGTSMIALLGITLGVGRAFSKITVFKVIMVAFNRRSFFLFQGRASICFLPFFAFLLDFYGSRVTALLTGGLFLTNVRITAAPKWCQIRRLSEPNAGGGKAQYFAAAASPGKTISSSPTILPGGRHLRALAVSERHESQHEPLYAVRR